ncbi:MAG: glycosyltransferase family 2 protein [Lachnospiraceae bacterium]|nr:glycosyltransferase family 2 protein [Lachnospiraceae bacterium]
MRLTIFTPTYNRRRLLGRVYESLLAQTVNDFEWLIVDDGSTDGTGDEVKGWIDEGRIKIRYSYRENGGKMRAHNTGVSLAEGDLFVCLDSDDVFTKSAVEDLLAAYDRAKAGEGGGRVGGVVAHKGVSGKEIYAGVDFPISGLSTLYGLYLKGFSGETTLMYETAILAEFPFPEIEGEKYVPEDYIYDKIDNVCVLAILPAIVTVCEIVSDGYTVSVKKLKRDNPCAFYLFYEQRAFITPPGIQKLKYLGRFVIYAGRSHHKAAGGRISLPAIICGYLYALFLLICRKE